MPGIGTIGSLIAGGVLGLGLLWMIWRKINEGTADKIKAASNENMLKAKLQAEETEKKARAEVERLERERIEREKQRANRTDDPTDL